MTLAWWGAITGTLGLVLVLAREWFTMFPVIRTEVVHGYEAENRAVGESEPPLLVGAWCGVYVKNWSARPVEIITRGVLLDTGAVVVFQASSFQTTTTTIGPWATYTFRVPLTAVLALPGADAADGRVVPFVATTERKQVEGRPAPLVGPDLRFTRDQLLDAVAGLVESPRSDPPRQHADGVFAVTESGPGDERDVLVPVRAPDDAR